MQMETVRVNKELLHHLTAKNTCNVIIHTASWLYSKETNEEISDLFKKEAEVINRIDGFEMVCYWRLTSFISNKPNELVSIGEGPNDIEMLRHIGIGVAMGNASEEVKAAPDFVFRTFWKWWINWFYRTLSFNQKKHLRFSVFLIIWKCNSNDYSQ